MRPSYCTLRGTEICEIRAGRGGDGAGAGAGGWANFATRAEKLLCACVAWMDERAMCELDTERSCVRPVGLAAGANVGVLAVVKARVVVEVLGWEKEMSASSLPSQRCRVGL